MVINTAESMIPTNEIACFEFSCLGFLGFQNRKEHFKSLIIRVVYLLM